ncbi:MAG: hypothetical protein HOM11_06040, partial [Methylococcales bacterium]|nr:hypothetical protein [Methylococcales bacterium]
MAGDPYSYPTSWTLINKLDIRDINELQDIERVATTIRSGESMPQGKLDSAHLKSVHKHLFQDIYAWAGEYRTTDIRKMSNKDKTFTPNGEIDSKSKQLDQSLAKKNHLKGLPQEQFSKEFADYIIEANTIHHFREGNGRSLRAFTSIIAKEAGYNIDYTKVDKTEWNKASKQSFDGDKSAMYKIVADNVKPIQAAPKKAMRTQYNEQQIKELYPDLIELADSLQKQNKTHPIDKLAQIKEKDPEAHKQLVKLHT